MRRLPLTTLLLPVALLTMALAMSTAAKSQRETALQAADRTHAAVELLAGLLDQETAVRGFLQTGRASFLEPYDQGEQRSERAEARLHDGADADLVRLLEGREGLEQRWEGLAARAIAAKRADPRYLPPLREAEERKALMDRLRLHNADIDSHLAGERDAALDAAARRSTVYVVLLTLALALLTYSTLAVGARRRRGRDATEARYRRTQREFSDVVQVVRDEPEAHALLKRHLEVQLPGTTATVLTRNNSDSRLEAATPASAAVASGLQDAEPSSCVAIRLARRNDVAADARPLLPCKVCGGTPGRTACEPLLVSGEVIGSVLLELPDAPVEEADRRIADTVSQAAPVLANLRNLALAERRAATDALTGLPNRRAVQDTLLRMSAQAARNVQPLAAIALDLDHFKAINDTHGHDMGDTVLAHVAALLTASVRASDLAGRVGGEEFIVLAPDTGREGALTLAENLRVAFEHETIPGLDRRVTASLGVAVLPDDAGTGEQLLRLADRALYAAKAAGRNRVECVAAPAAATEGVQ